MLLSGLISACAADGPPDRPLGPGEQPGGGPIQTRPSLFISPAGEPFRAGPGEPYPSAIWFARADTNHDGRLDLAEMRADATRFFHLLDSNHDGVIDSVEVGVYEQTIVPEILGAYLGGAARPGGEPPGREAGGPPSGGRGRGGRHGGGAGPGSTGPAPRGGDDGPGAGYEGAAPYELINEPEPVMAADRDFSGRITLAEFLGAIDRRFDELDKAHAGAIAFADLPLTPVQQAEAKMKGGHRRLAPDQR